MSPTPEEVAREFVDGIHGSYIVARVRDHRAALIADLAALIVAQRAEAFERGFERARNEAVSEAATVRHPLDGGQMAERRIVIERIRALRPDGGRT